MKNIKDLEPQAVWGFFDEITKVPRPSKYEEKIIAYLKDFAVKHSLGFRQDAIGNVVITRPASKGYERAPAVVLQSHVDMVAEKNSGVEFDFLTDPINAYVDGEWVKAKGTTLGADCGIGMAAELAALVADIPHARIEALFTVDEETGLTGAFGLGTDLLTGKYLINLDSEEEGEIFIGCAGGIGTVATFTYGKEDLPAGYKGFKVNVSGLGGGHSGDDIHRGLGNSNKILNRFLWNAAKDFGLRLACFDGGNLHNAIPREAFALFAVPADKEGGMRACFGEFADELKEEFRHTEHNMAFGLEEHELAQVIDMKTQSGLLDALCGVVNGVLAMSYAMPGLVETSTNLASVKFEGGDKIVVTTSQRSSVESAKYDAMNEVGSIFRLAGAEVVHSDGYPGWTPDPDSELLAVVKGAYKELFSVDPKVRAIHAGLECGLFLEKYPDLEMVSFGPTLRGVHSPDERLGIESVGKFWELLKLTLAKLK